jgi:peptide/nickel transport system permease protein
MNRWVTFGKHALRTSLAAIPTMLGIIVLSFLVLNLLPGDAADAIAGMSGSASRETTDALRHSFGLDQSVVVRLGQYVSGILHLDLGQSTSYRAPVIEVVLSRLPNTLLLMLTSFAVALVVGVLSGWAMAAFSGKWPDRLLTSLLLLLYSAPGFWLGLMAIVLFSVKLQLLPSDGSESIGAGLVGWAHVIDVARHLVLPTLALAPVFVAVYARLTRATMIEVLRQDHIRTAAAKGLHPFRLQLRHGLRNALIPVTTVAGLHFGNLLGGAIVVETVFNWPGLGRLTLDSLIARDFPVLLGVLLLSSATVIVVNVLIDWLLVLLDPRITR